MSEMGIPGSIIKSLGRAAQPEPQHFEISEFKISFRRDFVILANRIRSKYPNHARVIAPHLLKQKLTSRHLPSVHCTFRLPP